LYVFVSILLLALLSFVAVLRPVVIGACCCTHC
jgi:hypothetical protein